jgi:hypothetical protein
LRVEGAGFRVQGRGLSEYRRHWARGARRAGACPQRTCRGFENASRFRNETNYDFVMKQGLGLHLKILRIRREIINQVQIAQTRRPPKTHWIKAQHLFPNKLSRKIQVAQWGGGPEELAHSVPAMVLSHARGLSSRFAKSIPPQIRQLILQYY